MAEREAAVEAEAAGEVGIEPITPAAAMAVGLRKAKAQGKADPMLDAFLLEQTDLVRIQKEHLHEQRVLVTSRLKLGRWKDRVSLALQLLTVLVGLAIAGAVGVMAWQAHEDHGVAIEAFSVPPDFTARGMTGQVVANQLLDEIADLQQKTVTQRPASSYANDWGGDIKVEIPETGVSVGELNRWLRQWLGAETRISGEVVRTPTGVAVTARTGQAPGRRFEGAQADVDKLIGKAAEAVYAQTQPYRFAVYLQSSGRDAQARAAYTRIAQSGTSVDRPWALTGLASLLLAEGDFQQAAKRAEEAMRLDPRLAAAYRVALVAEAQQNHLWAAYEIPLQAMQRLTGEDRTYFDPPLKEALGAYLEAAQEHGASTLSSEGRARFLLSPALQALDLVYAHEVTRGRAVIAHMNPAEAQGAVQLADIEVLARAELDDWAGLLALPQAYLGRQSTLALAHAMVGHLQTAKALIAATPLDCDNCVVTRGMVAAAAHDWADADRWFQLATHRAPQLPSPPSAWGQALMAKGDLDGAITKFRIAHSRGPDFADPLEFWGEALSAKRDYAGAAVKFAEADKHAPRWGKNHLHWGEALMLSGRYAEARAQYETANGLDLSKPDRAALDVLLARTAKGPLHG